jgi:hypothetical protein
MKLFNFVTGAVVALAIIAGNMTAMIPSAKAQAIDNDPDCDKFSVMWCGSFSSSAIINKYEKGDGHNSAANIQSIYTSFGISKAEVLAGGYVDGIVYQNGDVTVGGTVVAKNASTYIRTMGKVSTSKMASAQTALVKLNKDGQFQFAIMKPCGNPVSAKNVVPPKPPAPKPIYNCIALSSHAIDVKTRKYGYTLSYTAKNGATLKDVNYDFGDGQKQNGVKPANVNSVTHTFAKAGKFTTTATLNFNVNGKVASVKCATVINAQPDACPINPSVPKDSPKCKACPTNPNVPVDSPECATPPPSEIPNTGAGSTIGLFIGSVLVSAAAYRLWIIRKLS